MNASTNGRTRALVVYCHPCQSSFTAAVRDRVLAGLEASNADVRLHDLYADGFDPAFSSLDHAINTGPDNTELDNTGPDNTGPDNTGPDNTGPDNTGSGWAELVPDPSVTAYGDDLLWCDTLVLVYPSWWAAQPAMLKGWIDRVWMRDVAWTLTERRSKVKPGEQETETGTLKSGKLRPNLRNIKRIVAVTTHGSPRYVNAVEGESGKRTVTRVLRSMCHPLTRTSWLALYNIDRSTDAQRAKFLDRVEAKLTARRRQ